MSEPVTHRIEARQQADGRWLLTREDPTGTTAKGWLAAESTIVGSLGQDSGGLMRCLAEAIRARGVECVVVPFARGAAR